MGAFFKRSVLVVLLLMGATLSPTLAFSLSDVTGALEAGSDAIGSGPKEGLNALNALGDGGGEGFYMTIYQDVIRNPNRAVEDQIKERFGIDFRVDLDPQNVTGQFLFTDFFRDYERFDQPFSRPRLQDSLRSDCLRVKTAQAEDVARRWRLVKRRLTQRAKEPPEGTPEPADQNLGEREQMLRLLELVDDETNARVDEALKRIPEFQGLENQQVLLRCYEDLSETVDFEMRLQTILGSLRKQSEVMQTFMNGRLDDFQQSVPLTDLSFGSAFPKYDLLFDIDVIDYLFFGAPVDTNIGRAGEAVGVLPGAGGYNDYELLVNDTTEPSDEDAADEDAATGPGGGPSDPNGNGELEVEGDGTVSAGGFGSSSAVPAGPFCAEPHTGLQLDFSALGGEPAAEEEAGELVVPVVDSGGEDDDAVAAVADPSAEGEEGAPIAGDAASEEGFVSLGLNAQRLCEGTTGVNFGNEFLRLLFCITISFDKVGKTWETVRDDECIACHVYKMNEVFEELIFSQSVRPRKNTGTIMESAICEDGFGDDIGFHFALEWVPVRFYEDICYPQGGVTDSDYAELIGYPELVELVDRPGFYVECQADFKDAKARERCTEALGGPQLSYESFQQAYLSSLDLQKPLQEIDDADRSNVWVRLVGDQGVAERELHVFLYRLGKDLPRFGEEERIEQDFKKRLAYLKGQMEAIRQDDSLIVDGAKDQKVEQLMCLRGYFFGAQERGQSKALNCRSYDDTFKKLDEDIENERSRVMRLVRRWNARSADFNGENQCKTFTGSGIGDAVLDTFKNRFSPDFYLDTERRKTQSTREQLTGQIAANSDLSDFQSLFEEIGEQVQVLARAQQDEESKQAFETAQQVSLQLFGAFGEELAAFQVNLRAFTNWWSEMVDKKEFISKGGQRINVLESFFEKLR